MCIRAKVIVLLFLTLIYLQYYCKLHESFITDCTIEMGKREFNQNRNCINLKSSSYFLELSDTFQLKSGNVYFFFLLFLKRPTNDGFGFFISG